MRRFLHPPGGRAKALWAVVASDMEAALLDLFCRFQAILRGMRVSLKRKTAPVAYLRSLTSGRLRSRFAAESEVLVPVQMDLRRIIINEVHVQQVIMLREVEGERSFPIVIGIFEATSIDRRIKGMPSPRPLTHDLVASVIENMGGELRDVFISELREHTYYAKLRIRIDGEMVEVDSRPSDAIALAVTAKVPIYVAEDVLDEVCGE